MQLVQSRAPVVSVRFSGVASAAGPGAWGCLDPGQIRAGLTPSVCKNAKEGIRERKSIP